MSTQPVECAAPVNGAPERRPLSPPAVRPGERAAATALLPPAAVMVALLVHRFIPNQQSALPTRVYPLLLQVGLAVTLLLAAAQWAFRPLRPWARHNSPLMAGAVLLLCLWDLITLKLGWMRLPFFPGPDVVFPGLGDGRPILLASPYDSLQLLLAGYAAGVVAGVVSGGLLGWFLRVRYWGMPLMKMVGPIPATALIPLAMVLFPNAFLSGMALIGWAVWFPVTTLTNSGIA